ncbi:MAG: histidine kinase [Flavobacteriaceae bacterium]|nr:histidine kinase [Flavobacteriaceae bacterium]|tara:strand:- start:127710 stop:128465 length:756 start_codon:yes stop_codon:yes gene_type:complete
MEQETTQAVIIISTVVIILITFMLLLLFAFFQKRKNELLIAQEKAREEFEKEIAEAQVEIREETLRNISWELHDNIGQLLTLAKIQLQSQPNEQTKEVSETISKGLNEVRALSKMINPEAIKQLNLKESIRLEIDRLNRLSFINAQFSTSDEEVSIDQKSSIIIFRILQEFFSNTIKHSKANNLIVELTAKPEGLEVVAKDDGIGFDMEKIKQKGIGLLNIANRAKLIGAKVELNSELSKGTTLKIEYANA